MNDQQRLARAIKLKRQAITILKKYESKDQHHRVERLRQQIECLENAVSNDE